MSLNQNLNKTEPEATVRSPQLTLAGKIFVFAVLFVFAAAAFIIFSSAGKNESRSTYSGTTQAKTTKNNYVGYIRDDHVYDVGYQYNISGKVYDESARMRYFDESSDKFPPNKITTFCYDPDSPQDGYFLENFGEKECGR